MKFVPSIEIPQIAIVSAFFLLSVAGWNSAPARIAVHWNARGQVDRYGGKIEGLLVVPIIALVLYLGGYFLLGVIGNDERVRFSFTLFRFASLITMAAVYALIQFNARGFKVPLGTVVILVVLVDWLALGNLLWRAIAVSRLRG